MIANTRQRREKTSWDSIIANTEHNGPCADALDKLMGPNPWQGSYG